MIHHALVYTSLHAFWGEFLTTCYMKLILFIHIKGDTVYWPLVHCLGLNMSKWCTRSRDWVARIKHRKVMRGFFRLPAVITHLGEKDCEGNKRWQDGWLARIHRQDLKPKSCVLRSLRHRETHQVVWWHTSGPGTVAKLGVQREDQWQWRKMH